MTVSPPPGSPEHASWRHFVRVAAFGHLRLKATSLLIAVLLWLLMKARQPVLDYVPVVVEPTLDSTLVLLDAPPQLKALVVGRVLDIVKLRVDPLVIHRAVRSSATDTLVLEFTPGEVRVPADLADQVRVLDVLPRSATLRFRMRSAKR